MYEAAGVYPMHGESCYNFFRECHYYGQCTMATEYLTSEQDTEPKVEEFQIELTLQNLIESQLSKA